MTTFIILLLFLVAVGLLVPSLLLFVECALAMLPGRLSRTPPASPRPSVAVLIPAHNEEMMITETIRSVIPQLAPGDRLVAIADNCTDGTAAAARRAGATVSEREDPTHRGRGYALEHGVRHLSREPPGVVVILDADCTLHAGSLDELARRAAFSGRPVQARNIVVPPPSAGTARCSLRLCVPRQECRASKRARTSRSTVPSDWARGWRSRGRSSAARLWLPVPWPRTCNSGRTWPWAAMNRSSASRLS